LANYIGKFIKKNVALHAQLLWHYIQDLLYYWTTPDLEIKLERFETLISEQVPLKLRLCYQYYPSWGKINVMLNHRKHSIH